MVYGDESFKNTINTLMPKLYVSFMVRERKIKGVLFRWHLVLIFIFLHHKVELVHTAYCIKTKTI